jgi:hypothetical protein
MVLEAENNGYGIPEDANNVVGPVNVQGASEANQTPPGNSPSSGMSRQDAMNLGGASVLTGAADYLINKNPLGALSTAGRAVGLGTTGYTFLNPPKSDFDGIKIIDSPDEREYRPLTEEEMRHLAAVTGVTAGLAAGVSTGNPLMGANVTSAVSPLAYVGLKAWDPQVGKSFYVMKSDMDQFKKDREEWNAKVDDIRSNNTYSGD